MFIFVFALSKYLRYKHKYRPGEKPRKSILRLTLTPIMATMCCQKLWKNTKNIDNTKATFPTICIHHVNKL